MRLSGLATVVSTFGLSYGFVPGSIQQKQALVKPIARTDHGPFNKRRQFFLSNGKLLTEPIEPRDDVDVRGANPIEEVAVDISFISDGNVIDGTKFVTETISSSKPGDLFNSADIMDSKFVGEKFPSDSSKEEFKQVSDPLSPAKYADFTNSSKMNEDVKAVLEASSLAAAEAEASMAPDLIEQLEFSLVSNATEAVSEPLVVEEIPDILAASSVVGEALTADKIATPSVAKILKFAIPAIGVWLCGPLLSLIDTSAVGLFSGTVQQAALNPAVAVTDYAALLIAFMYTGTTNLVAAAQESDRTSPDKPITTRTLIGAMRLSAYVGAGLGAFLFAFARPLLRAIIGNDSISPAVFAAAMKYVRIRSLGMPAAAIIGSTQAACLGMQDIRSPLYVLVAAAVANFFGDVFFVGNTHPLVGGAAGAAWATVLSQYVGVALFVKWLCNKPTKKPAVINLSTAILEMTGKPINDDNNRRQQGLRESLEKFRLQTNLRRPKMPHGVKKILQVLPKRSTKTRKPVESVSVRGFLKDKFTFRDFLKAPSKETREQFSPYLIPVTSTQVGRVSGYVAMSHVVASSLGTASMAAQQVIVSLFYCLTPIADSLSLTAQSFLPSISERRISRERSSALQTTTKNFLKAGGIFGAAMMAAVSAIPLFTGFFTSDPAVITMVNSVVPLLLAFFGVHGVLCSAEGLLLGQKDLNFLGRMYVAFFVVVPFLMMRVKAAALTGSAPVNLVSVWKVFLGYQMFRVSAWVGRVAILQRRTAAKAEQAEKERSELSLLAP